MQYLCAVSFILFRKVPYTTVTEGFSTIQNNESQILSFIYITKRNKLQSPRTPCFRTTPIKQTTPQKSLACTLSSLFIFFTAGPGIVYPSNLPYKLNTIPGSVAL
jgi:hypothetical protein